jgi:hypothetical protein
MEALGGSHSHFPYDIYQDRMPAGIPLGTREMLQLIRDAFVDHAESASLVIAYSPVSWAATRASVHLHTVANFQSLFRYLNDVAKLLAPIYSQYGILPLVVPHRLEEWRFLCDFQPTLFATLSKRGLLTYAARQHE